MYRGGLRGGWHSGLDYGEELPTLETGLDHIEGMDGESGYRAGREAGNGLDQRGGEARMVFVHKVRRVVDVIMVCVEGKK
jgi:hypothetical protein